MQNKTSEQVLESQKLYADSRLRGGAGGGGITSILMRGSIIILL